MEMFWKCSVRYQILLKSYFTLQIFFSDFYSLLHENIAISQSSLEL